MKGKYTKILIIFAMFSAVLKTECAFAVHKLGFIGQVHDTLEKVQEVKKDVELKVDNVVSILNGKVLQAEGVFEGFIGAEGVALYRAYVPQGFSGGIGALTSQAMSGNFNFSNWQDTAGVTGLVDGVKTTFEHSLDNVNIKNIKNNVVNYAKSNVGNWATSLGYGEEYEIVNGVITMKNNLSQLNDISNVEQDILTLERFSNDYKNTVAKAKYAKMKEVNTELTKLYAIKATNTLVGENLSDLAEDIASLEAQKLMLSQQESVSEDGKETKFDKTLLNYQKKLDGLREKLDALNEVNQDSLLMKGLNLKIDNTINKLLPFGDEENAYDTYMDRLFVPANKITNAKNKEKVDTERNKEYYEAVLNLFKTSANNLVMASDIDDKMTAMRGATTVADGVYGSKSMEVGIAVQLAKSAALYMDTQVAKLRYRVASDIIKWVDMYQLGTDNHNIAEFNLADYDFKTVKRRKKLNSLGNKAASKAAEFLKLN